MLGLRLDYWLGNNFKNDLRQPQSDLRQPQSGGEYIYDDDELPNSLDRDTVPAPGPTGADGCRSGVKTAAHESQCDLYYECYGDQVFSSSCPNGLMYNGGGAFGLLGPCDYPHNVDCTGREGRSKLSNPFDGLLVLQGWCHVRYVVL